jgi:hypothetical protein
MQLNDLKPAWKQLTLLDAMHNMDSREILSIIETSENASRSKIQRALNLAMFIVITIFCQAG